MELVFDRQFLLLELLQRDRVNPTSSHHMLYLFVQMSMVTQQTLSVQLVHVLTSALEEFIQCVRPGSAPHRPAATKIAKAGMSVVVAEQTNPFVLGNTLGMPGNRQG